MTETIRWGILGTGNIAKQFARGLKALPDAELVAVGSRSEDTADLFADTFNIPHRHASYEALANDPDVDVVYIGTPHSYHRDNAILCLEAGKSVLCEKPFAINAHQAAEMIRVARDNDLFLMEAMWTRFMPIMVKVRELLREKVIGDVRIVEADFGFRTNFNPKSRLFDPALGGGALLDVGIYPVNLAFMVLGPPTRITSLAHLGPTHVDEQGAIIFGYRHGELALLSTAIRTQTPNEAFLMGTNGQIHIHPRWWFPATMTVSVQGEKSETIQLALEGNGYNYEAAEVMRCLRDGDTESPIMPLHETLSIMETLDEIRSQWGLKYPME
jgi:predicted dehydrogenase